MFLLYAVVAYLYKNADACMWYMSMALQCSNVDTHSKYSMNATAKYYLKYSGMPATKYHISDEKTERSQKKISYF